MKKDIWLQMDGYIVWVHGFMPERQEDCTLENGILAERNTYSTATVNGLNNWNIVWEDCCRNVAVLFMQECNEKKL